MPTPSPRFRDRNSGDGGGFVHHPAQLLRKQFPGRGVRKAARPSARSQTAQERTSRPRVDASPGSEEEGGCWATAAGSGAAPAPRRGRAARSGEGGGARPGAQLPACKTRPASPRAAPPSPTCGGPPTSRPLPAAPRSPTCGVPPVSPAASAAPSRRGAPPAGPPPARRFLSPLRLRGRNLREGSRGGAGRSRKPAACAPAGPDRAPGFAEEASGGSGVREGEWPCCATTGAAASASTPRPTPTVREAPPPPPLHLLPRTPGASQADPAGPPHPLPGPPGVTPPGRVPNCPRVRDRTAGPGARPRHGTRRTCSPAVRFPSGPGWEHRVPAPRLSERWEVSQVPWARRSVGARARVCVCVQRQTWTAGLGHWWVSLWFIWLTVLTILKKKNVLGSDYFEWLRC